MSFGTMVVLFLIAAVVIAIFQLQMTAKRKEKMEKRLKIQPNFKPTQKIMAENGLAGIAIDENSKKICLIDNSGPHVTTRTFSYKDVLSCEIFSDGDSITKTYRTSQAGGALVGGLLLGGVGAIIGGLSGSKKNIEKVKTIDLRIVVNDTNKPTHDVNLMDIETKKNSFIHKAAMEKARHWHSLVAVLIKRADEEDKVAENSLAPQSEKQGSVADELSKLLELKEKGILTEEEFAAQKVKILS
ncbi:SHOCT domain-containing protein [Alkalimonas mucilaginosa]|uniref:SHOCT domain-containing protein n=1 Tax=Alkalimonas mucilaginosa TaxID=3057676 RepID=A0ABU7JH84_9GAMM|nr:SHOCT domain-containing protein [Alkalimonas sp. MEB004]MEE2025048.1 SHOCT domain-containing protein [Alkalimonas sp. MEB004]